MAGRDGNELWYWQDAFKLDLESPPATSGSFWDELIHNGVDSNSLFASTPVPDLRDSSPAFFPLASQGSEQHGSSDYAFQNGERHKRRRMLQFAGPRRDGFAAEAPSFGPTFHSTFENCINPVVHGCEELLIPVPTSPNNVDLKKAQLPVDNWMLRCFEENGANSLHEAMTVPGATINDITGCCSQQWKTHEAEMLKGPLTPFPKPPTHGKKSSSSRPSRFKEKSSTPVAYPFALLKPCGAQGDVTLNDINQRLLSPSPRAVHRLFAPDEERPPPQSWSGLSGKSVVACTKIHTEGNGTITITRTRG